MVNLKHAMGQNIGTNQSSNFGGTETKFGKKQNDRAKSIKMVKNDINRQYSKYLDRNVGREGKAYLSDDSDY